MSVELPKLPYAENALEPVIDAQTMGLHHGKHHNTYVTKYNEAVQGTPLEGKPLREVLEHLGDAPEKIRTAVRNNGGGAFNHDLFWQWMAPKGQGGSPSAELAKAIDDAFGSMDKFKEAFAAKAAGQFGSGWAWLCVKNGKLEVCSTANQDNPIMGGIGAAAGCGGEPILGVDVWEHAYYLNYQNRRPDYVKAWWDVVHWKKVSELYAKAK